ncbi:MAG: hypothetical protein J0L61_07015 [Planctomycetes bacterium]|nr:hypothetical protein [Planctomycetota bacterium]
MNRSRNRRLVTRTGSGLAIAAATAAALALFTPAAHAIPRTATETFRSSWIGRSQSWSGAYNPGRVAHGHADTWFRFHPDWNTPEADEGFAKVFSNVEPDPPGFDFDRTDVYPGAEAHQTTGEVDHHIKGRIAPNHHGGKSWLLTDTTYGTINPGANTSPKRVAITVHTFDPWSFGSADQGAIFEANPAGFDVGFSVLAGTAFPAPAPASRVDELTPTIMTHAARVAPGVINDSRVFWTDPVGAIDLYRVTITADPAQHISVSLLFGQSNGQFALNFLDWTGAPFDPLDQSSVDAIGARILSGFTNGAVPFDIADVFSVGFTPIGLDAYTSGMAGSLDLSALEVPAPSAGTMALVAAAFACQRRRNR